MIEEWREEKARETRENVMTQGNNGVVNQSINQANIISHIDYQVQHTVGLRRRLCSMSYSVLDRYTWRKGMDLGLPNSTVPCC